MSFLALCFLRNRRLCLDGSERKHGSACWVQQRGRQGAVRSVFRKSNMLCTRPHASALLPALPPSPVVHHVD